VVGVLGTKTTATSAIKLNLGTLEAKFSQQIVFTATRVTVATRLFSQVTVRMITMDRVITARATTRIKQCTVRAPVFRIARSIRGLRAVPEPLLH
jgi:hypothetical protein